MNCKLAKLCGHHNLPEGCYFTQFHDYGSGELDGKYIELVRDRQCPMPVEIVISNLY